MRSYRRERMGELRDGMKARHEAAGMLVVERFIKPRTPIGTPETTGIEDYPVTYHLRDSISSRATEDHVDMGTNVEYAPYVHQGTYDFAHGYGGWDEASAAAAEGVFFHNRHQVTGRKGAMPRPFLVNGLVASKPFLYPIYSRPIN
jgi:hypothetical protein